jgi:hypothetical protein
MSIRNFWLKDKVIDGEIKVIHLGTADMVANILTKPVQGQQLIRERRMLTNWPEQHESPEQEQTEPKDNK